MNAKLSCQSLYCQAGDKLLFLWPACFSHLGPLCMKRDSIELSILLVLCSGPAMFCQSWFILLGSLRKDHWILNIGLKVNYNNYNSHLCKSELNKLYACLWYCNSKRQQIDCIQSTSTYCWHSANTGLHFCLNVISVLEILMAFISLLI